MSQFREWWITETAINRYGYQSQASGLTNVHVIEFSAYEELKKKYDSLGQSEFFEASNKWCWKHAHEMMEHQETKAKLATAIEALERIADNHCSHCDECAACGSQHGPMARVTLERITASEEKLK